MRIKIAKLYISPVVFHGYVEIKKESLLEMEKHELVIFFLSGAVGNVFLIGVSLLLVNKIVIRTLIVKPTYCVFVIVRENQSRFFRL